MYQKENREDLHHTKRLYKDYEKIKTKSKELSKTLDNLFNEEELKLSVPQNNMTLVQVSIAIRWSSFLSSQRLILSVFKIHGAVSGCLQ